jgi:hypothetical protein
MAFYPRTKSGDILFWAFIGLDFVVIVVSEQQKHLKCIWLTNRNPPYGVVFSDHLILSCAQPNQCHWIPADRQIGFHHGDGYNEFLLVLNFTQPSPCCGIAGWTSKIAMGPVWVGLAVWLDRFQPVSRPNCWNWLSPATRKEKSASPIKW